MRVMSLPGKTAGSGQPPANDLMPGESMSLLISRMADGTAQQALFEYKWARLDGDILNLEDDE